MEWKQFRATREWTRQMMIKRVLPAIKERWPNDVNDISTIVIQQDNATPHLRLDNAEFLSAAQKLDVPVEL